MALFDAAICCWDAKYYYFNPRPSQVNPKIKTLTGVPNFPAYTSGHSTFSGSAATILGHIVPSRAADYMTMAEEASNSRLYGAIHYRSDIEVGMAMGKMIGTKAIIRAKSDGAE
jgi:membrane-associated phospholipid phosphatase